MVIFCPAWLTKYNEADNKTGMKVKLKQYLMIILRNSLCVAVDDSS